MIIKSQQKKNSISKWNVCKNYIEEPFNSKLKEDKNAKRTKNLIDNIF